MTRWTAQVFVDSSVGEITANVEAGTFHGAKQQIERIYGPVKQIVNLREVHTPRGGGSSSSSGGGSLGGAFLGLIVLAGIGAFVGSGDNKSPSPAPQRPSIERSYEAPTRTYEPAAPVYEAPAPTYEAPVSTPEWDTEDDEDADDVWWEW